MGNVAINSVQNNDNARNFFDTSAIKVGATLESVQKDTKVHSLFLVVDENKNGKIDDNEFKKFINTDERDIGKIVVISPIIESKRILKTKELTKMLLKEKIKEKKEKIIKLIAHKKRMTLKKFIIAFGGGTLVGTALKLFFGANYVIAGGLSAIGVMALILQHHLFNKKIDAKIAELKAEISFLKSAYLLIS